MAPDRSERGAGHDRQFLDLSAYCARLSRSRLRPEMIRSQPSATRACAMARRDVCDLPVLRASLPLNLEFSLPASTMSPQQGAIVAAKSERARQYRAE